MSSTGSLCPSLATSAMRGSCRKAAGPLSTQKRTFRSGQIANPLRQIMSVISAKQWLDAHGMSVDHQKI